MNGFLTKEKQEKQIDEIAAWSKITDKTSDGILEKIYPEKYLQTIFGEYMEEITQYSRNPDLPDWIRGIATEKVTIIMNVFENFLAINSPDLDASAKSRLRERLIEKLVDYLNLSVARWLEVANWKFVILSNEDGKNQEIAFIHQDEILLIKRR